MIKKIKFFPELLEVINMLLPCTKFTHYWQIINESTNKLVG